MGACSQVVLESPQETVVLRQDKGTVAHPEFWYQHEKAQCSFAWQVNVGKEGIWSLRFRKLSGQKCTVSLPQLLSDYSLVLGKIFNEYEAKKLKAVTIEMMERFDPSQEIIKRQQQACLNNPAWHDYAKRYPNHASQKSSNRLFIESIKEIPEVNNLFAPHGLKLQIIAVEKVFTSKTSLSPVSLCFDAGQYDFSVTSLGDQ